ncbi:hypothetical protein KC19_11G016000 [Ceratodon purpureus]|uniref:Uncharacterized protein n=1 Tax=Ceratodon purpureus TaxID=3225 RepID=A0A8T0GBR9_CERPU|nr:hypothetical protein KC19_11G016000 [Ceratodon purpureus]
MATEVAVRSSVAIARAFAGRNARACHVCASKSAHWYCAADEAYLCTACDTQVHSANALSMRHERVRLTPNGTPKKRSSQSNLVPESDAPAVSRKRLRTSRPYSHHLRKLTRLSNQLVESKDGDSDSDSSFAVKAELELNFDFLDADEFLCSDGNQEVPSVSPVSSDVEFFAPDLDEFQEGDHTATSDSFTAFLKGKAAHSENVVIDSDQFLVPDAAFGDLCCFDTPTAAADTNIDLAGDAFFFPGDIPGLDGLESFAAPEMDLSDDFALNFDIALPNNGLDAFEGNGSVAPHVTGECRTEPAEPDQFMAGPFAKFFATKTKDEAEEPMGAERIKREAREMLKCCEGEATQKVMPSLQLDLKAVLTAWSDRGEPWMVDFKVPQMNDDSNSSGSDSTGLVPDMDGDRDARVMRYKEKRRTRLFSKKIRYEVRKLNAERRPRMKGRFVKRTGTSS